MVLQDFLVSLSELGGLLCLFIYCFHFVQRQAVSAAFSGHAETSDSRSSFPLYFTVLSHIIVRRFSKRLPQFYLQGHEGPHCHVEEDLPHVSQFIQIHVGQTDECKG